MDTPKILLVDDEADTQKSVVNLLNPKNYNITTIGSGEDALIYLAEQPDADVILLDILMPGLDGFEVLDAVKNNPKTKDIPVIMLAATNRVEDKVKAFDMGATDYLVKPVEERELIARIDPQLRLKQAAAALVASETRYRTIIDHAREAIIICDNGQCIFANRAVEQLLGYTKAQFLQLTLAEVFPEEYLFEIKKQLHPERSEHLPKATAAFAMRHRNGHRIPVELSITFIDYENKRVALLIARDITEQKNAQDRINALARFPTEAPNPILRISAGGQLMYSNIAGVDLLRLHDRAQISTTVPAEWRQVVAQSLHSNDRINIEYISKGRTYNCMFVPMTDLGYVNVYATDVTERIEAEDALRTSEARHRILAENVRDLITKLTLDGRYTYVSRVCRTMLGYTPAELAGWSFYELIHPDDLAEIKLMNPPVLHANNATPFTLRFKHKDGSYVWLETSLRPVYGTDQADVELVAVSRDVTERKTYEAALQTAYDEMERRVDERTAELTKSNYMLKQVIEQHKQAEAKIIEYNQQLLTLQYAGAAIASSLNLQYVLTTVTREMVDLLKVEGCAISEWDENRSVMSLLAKYGPEQWWINGPMQRPQTAQHTATTREYRQFAADQLNYGIKTLLVMPLVFQDREVGSIEIADSRSEHTFTRQEISLVQLLAGHAASAIENARLYQQAQQEIAERKKAEIALEQERATLTRRVDERTADLSAANAKLSRAARLKDEFLASMSHELRTPLNAVLSMSEALLEEVYGPLSDKQAKTLKNISESGRHLLALINDILDLSKIEAGKLDLQLDVVSVQQVAQASLLFVKQTAHKKQIKVWSNIDSQISTIRADERRLKQVLVNLLSNAVKFTPERGQIGLNIAADAQQNAVHFVVWDTGIGIPPDQMHRLFQPFVQLDSKLSRRYAGTGLGLTLVRRMAEMHGGSVSVESEEGIGSKFTVSLPWQGNNKTEPAILPDDSTTTTKVLIVANSAAVTEQYQRYAQEAGIEADTCQPESNLVEYVTATGPNAIILDMALPDSAGWEALANLKAEPQTRDIPVVIIAPTDYEAQARQLGAAEFLLKPIARRQFEETLTGICAKKPASTPVETHHNGHQTPGPQHHILLAEDNEINLRTVADYLSRAGFRVTPARTGFEVIQRAEEETPHLILMDIQMPEMDGLKATEYLRRKTQFVGVPIIALTALAMPGDRERCLQAGANDYISKPVSLKGLVETINVQLDNQSTNGGQP